MLITKELDITINTKLDRTYHKKGYYNKNKCDEIENIKIKIEDLVLSSSEKVRVKCDICGNEKEIRYYKYLKNIKKYNIYCCSQKCSSFKNKLTKKEKYDNENFNNREKAEKTCLINLGVKNPSQSDKIQEQKKERYFKIHGVSCPLKNEIVKEKGKQTKKERYDNEYYTNRDKAKQTNKDRNGDEYYNNKEKAEETCLINLGVRHSQQNSIVKEKTIQTNLIKLGVKCSFQSKDVIKKINITKNKNFLKKYKEYNIIKIKDYLLTVKCDKCNKNFIILKDLFYNRIKLDTTMCLNCNPICGDSDTQIEIYNFIKENYSGEIISNDKTILKPKELDIYLPELKLAFEYNGLWCHDERYRPKNYHLNKSDGCEKKGIQLIHIWGDDWSYKKDIIKSMILNKLNKNLNKIYARKCEIKKLDSKTSKDFLNNNHIQGFVGSPIRLGLYYNDELVSLMTFGKKRLFMKQKSSEEDVYELLRFCNKLNTSVIGGASRLFQYFIKNYNPKIINTYADRSYSNGNLYKQLGFTFIHKTEPNYYYVIDGIRKHRFGFRKDVLVKQGFDSNKTEHEIMLERKIYRIFNAGNLKYIIM